MAYSNERITAVRRAYIDNRLSLTQAASLNQVNYQTARAWKKKAEAEGKSWDKARAAQNLSEGTITDIANRLIDEYIIQHQASMALLKTDTDLTAVEHTQLLASMADSFSKTMASFKKINPTISELAVALDVLKLLAEHIKQNNPEAIQIFMEILEPFGEELTAHYG